MSLENHSLPTLPEQSVTPVIQEDFSTKIEKELIDQYKGSSTENTKDIKDVIQILSDNTEPSELNNVIKLLKSFPYSVKEEDMKFLYSIILERLKDSDEIETYTINPLLYIQKQMGIIKTQIENKRAKEFSYQQIRDIYINNKDNIHNSLGNLNKSTIINRIPAKELQAFREAFGYKIIQPEKPGEKPDNESWMMNDSIDNQIAGLVNYYATLHDKVEQAKTNPKIKVTEQEQLQSENFGKTLQSLSISPEEFYESVNIIYTEPSETNKSQGEKNDARNSNRGKGKIFGELGNIASSTEKGSNKLDKKGLESVTNLSENIGSMKDKTEFDSIFRNSNDGKIRSGFETEEFIKSFPYPKDTGESDFKIDNPNLPQIIKNILASNTSRPIIDTSTQDVSKIMRAKQSAILYHIIKNNPTISEDDKKSLAKILYPNKKKSWILGRSNDQIQGNIEKNLLGPLIMNTFCSEQKEQQINNETKKGYFSYINTFIKNTPGLQDFKIKSQRIEITNDGVKIPLYFEGDKRANAYLTLKDGKIYITNKFYNPGNVNSNNEITQGKVMVGYMDDIQTFRDKITKEINPDIIKETLVTNNPPAIYEEHIQKIIDNNIRSASRDSESQSTSAGISHGLSQIKTQDSVIDTMKLRHSDGNTNIDNNKPIDSKSPFYLALRDYNTKNSEAAITKQNQPDTFDSLALIRTTMLRNSAGENEKMKDNFIALQNLIKSESFNTRIESYLQQQAPDQLSQQRHLILQTLTHTNRTRSDSFSLFLKLFGTSPQLGKEQINTIDNNRFGEFIQQLHGDLNNLSVNTLIPSTHPVLATLEKKYNTSADDDLMASLDTITDTEKVETIIT